MVGVSLSENADRDISAGASATHMKMFPGGGLICPLASKVKHDYM